MALVPKGMAIPIYMGKGKGLLSDTVGTRIQGVNFATHDTKARPNQVFLKSPLIVWFE